MGEEFFLKNLFLF